MKLTLIKTKTTISTITIDVDNTRITPEFPALYHGKLMVELHGWDSSVTTVDNKILERDEQYYIPTRNPIND